MHTHIYVHIRAIHRTKHCTLSLCVVHFNAYNKPARSAKSARAHRVTHAYILAHGQMGACMHAGTYTCVNCMYILKTVIW